jgi:hypothetical protein
MIVNDINININTFESLRDLIIEKVKISIENEETYIVCNIYARFSIYIISSNKEFLQQLKNNLGDLVERVELIDKNGFIYQDLNNPTFTKPVNIIRNIFYIDRQIQLNNWNIQKQYQSKSPIVCFYSFKGGLGRTTAMALVGMQLARSGKKVLLMDLDLEAPGLASLFSYQYEDILKINGVVDYLVDLSSMIDYQKLRLTDYYYTINQQDIVGNQGGEIVIMSAGRSEGSENLYFTKLSKLNLLFTGNNQSFGLDILLKHIEEDIKPDYILIDTRTGLNELGGLFISRYAHSAFLFFFGNQQNMFGMETIIPKLRDNKTLKFYLVNSPVPKPPLAEEQRQYYLEKSYDLFSDLYYNDDMGVPFIQDQTAPHFPIEVPYNDLAVLLNHTEKLKSLLEYNNGENPYLKISELIFEKKKIVNVPEINVQEANKQLVKAFQGIVPSSAAAEYEFQNLEQLTQNFYPRKEYKFIFDKNKFLILGEKGVGKTALYAILGYASYAQALADYCEANTDELKFTEWIKGLDKTNEYPSKPVFDELKNSSQKECRIFWKKLIVKFIVKEQDRNINWKGFLQEVKNESELDLDGKISQIDKQYKSESKYIIVIYDYLDLLIDELDGLRGKLISALLEVWRDIYNRYQHIRTKIFLRKDIFDREVDLTDKVKFNNNIAEITWNYDQLLNVVWKRVIESNSYKNSIIAQDFENILLRDSSNRLLGYLPNAEEHTNREILKKLLGEYMGGNNKAFPYNWILYHVSDTKRRIQPRSLLNLFSETARKQMEDNDFPNDNHLLRPRYMELANKEVSERRLQDIREEYPSLQPVFDDLKNYLEQLPVLESQLDSALKQLNINLEINEIKRRLEEIGVLYEYKLNRKETEKRYHIPDLYLIGMGLKRKGPGAHKALFGKK